MKKIISILCLVSMLFSVIAIAHGETDGLQEFSLGSFVYSVPNGWANQYETDAKMQRHSEDLNYADSGNLFYKIATSDRLFSETDLPTLCDSLVGEGNSYEHKIKEINGMPAAIGKCNAEQESGDFSAHFAIVLNGTEALVVIMVYRDLSPKSQSEFFAYAVNTVRTDGDINSSAPAPATDPEPLKETTVPAGTYTVGTDIPAGVYSIKVSPSMFSIAMVQVTNPGDKYPKMTYSVSDGEDIGKIELVNGAVIEISLGSVIFSPYSGLGF